MPMKPTKAMKSLVTREALTPQEALKAARAGMVIERRQLLLGGLFLPLARAHAQSPTPVSGPPELVPEIIGLRLLGRSQLRFLGLRVYEARLWVGAQAPGVDWSATSFALELQYARSLKGELIADRSLAEMRRQGEINDVNAERWLGNMKQLLPDVQPGDRITGLNLPGVGARFYFNGQLRGEPREPEFAKLFFGIWLSPRTSESAMREQLLGRQAP